MALEQELATYQERLPELLAQEGRFVVIHAKEIAGCFDTYGDALQVGYDRFQLAPFLVKQIHAVEPTLFIGHAIT
jgi:hypothetical protein